MSIVLKIGTLRFFCAVPETDFVTFLPMKDLGVLNKDIIGIKKKQLKEVSKSYTYFANNDVLLAKITPCFENRKIGIANNLENGIGFGSSEYIVFRSLGGLESSFIYYFLSRRSFVEEGKNRI
jgi:type I restriction enzyme S subunit